MNNVIINRGKRINRHKLDINQLRDDFEGGRIEDIDIIDALESRYMIVYGRSI